MDDTLILVLLSFAMLVGCYIAGSIPLAISFSEEKLKLVSVTGAGLLVGTALSVIVPEGIHTLYASSIEGQKLLLKEASPHSPENHVHAEDHDHHHHEVPDLNMYIGTSLVLGFVFMLLIDQICGGGHSHSTIDTESQRLPSSSITATLGLVVHAAADGVALGAAARTQTSVELIVFIAIMLHKAPAAFGLVSFLLHERYDRNRIRRHLGIFSAAAPLLALITYFGLSQSSKETLTKVNATGIAMLFSAGTFLYVATVHVLPELAARGSQSSHNDVNSNCRESQKGFSRCELLFLVLGAIAPLFLSIGHHH